MIVASAMMIPVKPKAMTQSGNIVTLKPMATSARKPSSAPTNASSSVSTGSPDAGLEHRGAAAAAMTCRISSHTNSITCRIRISAAKGPTNAGGSVGGAESDGTATMTARRLEGDAEGEEVREDSGMRATAQETELKQHKWREGTSHAGHRHSYPVPHGSPCHSLPTLPFPRPSDRHVPSPLDGVDTASWVLSAQWVGGGASAMAIAPPSASVPVCKAIADQPTAVVHLPVR